MPITRPEVLYHLPLNRSSDMFALPPERVSPDAPPLAPAGARNCWAKMNQPGTPSTAVDAATSTGRVGTLDDGMASRPRSAHPASHYRGVGPSLVSVSAAAARSYFIDCRN